MGRAPCCDKGNVKRGPWSPDEDATLKTYLQKNGTGGNWISLPQRAGLKRCGKSCRLRWLNYLRPDIKHGTFTEEEDNTIISMYYKMGSRWSVIAANLPGRTDNDVKNHWNTKLKKKLFGAGSNNNIIINNSKLNPRKTDAPFTNMNHIINPLQVCASSSSSPLINSYVDDNTTNKHNYGNNPSHNHHQIYAPFSGFTDLLAQFTNAASMSSLLPNCTTISNPHDHNYALGSGVTGAGYYPFHQALLMAQAGSGLTSAANASVCPRDEVSSASGSSSVVYGSSIEDDPFLAELGFGLTQEEVMMNPACSYDVDQEDVKDIIKIGGLGQGVANQVIS